MWPLLEGGVVAMPRPYPPEFRQRALDLVRSGRCVPEVAKLLGIAESCLYRWKRQDLIDRGLEPGTSGAESAELVAARQKIRDLEEENKILRQAAAAVQEVVSPKERYRLVAEVHGDGVRVPPGLLRARRVHPRLLRVEDPGAVSPAGPARLADRPDRAASYGTYGQPRVRAELQRRHGLVAGHNTVMLLMRRAGISGLPLRRRAQRVPAQKTVTDLVKRQFTADGPNRLRVTGITEHPTRDGKVYCCVVTGVFSRRVAGWATGTAQRSDLATNALGMAIDSRRPSPGAIIHGDHGTQGGFNRSSQHCSLD